MCSPWCPCASLQVTCTAVASLLNWEGMSRFVRAVRSMAPVYRGAPPQHDPYTIFDGVGVHTVATDEKLSFLEKRVQVCKDDGVTILTMPIRFFVGSHPPSSHGVHESREDGSSVNRHHPPQVVELSKAVKGRYENISRISEEPDDDRVEVLSSQSSISSADHCGHR